MSAHPSGVPAATGDASERPPPTLSVRAGRFFFRYRNGISPAAVLILLVLIPPVRATWSASADLILDASGVLVSASGQALRLAVIGFAYILRGGHQGRVYARDLVTRGLFGVSRNPLYLGNLLIYAGLIIIWNSPWMYLLGGAFFFFMYYSIVATEESFLHETFGPEYERYCEEVPRWIPDLRRLRGALEGISFNWRRVFYKDYGTIAAWGLTACTLMIVETLLFDSYLGHEMEIRALSITMILIVIFWGTVRWFKLYRRPRA